MLVWYIIQFAFVEDIPKAQIISILALLFIYYCCTYEKTTSTSPHTIRKWMFEFFVDDFQNYVKKSIQHSIRIRFYEYTSQHKFNNFIRRKRLFSSSLEVTRIHLTLCVYSCVYSVLICAQKIRRKKSRPYNEYTITSHKTTNSELLMVPTLLKGLHLNEEKNIYEKKTFIKSNV